MSVHGHIERISIENSAMIQSNVHQSVGVGLQIIVRTFDEARVLQPAAVTNGGETNRLEVIPAL